MSGFMPELSAKNTEWLVPAARSHTQQPFMNWNTTHPWARLASLSYGAWLPSRQTQIQFHFGSPSSSRVIVYRNLWLSPPHPHPSAVTKTLKYPIVSHCWQNNVSSIMHPTPIPPQQLLKHYVSHCWQSSSVTYTPQPPPTQQLLLLIH